MKKLRFVPFEWDAATKQVSLLFDDDGVTLVCDSWNVLTLRPDGRVLIHGDIDVSSGLNVDSDGEINVLYDSVENREVHDEDDDDE